MHTKISTRKGVPRIGRVAAALAVVIGSALIAWVDPVAAQPADGASTSSNSCAIHWDRAHTYYEVRCDTIWPWEDFVYLAWVRCTDDRTYYGEAHSSFWQPGWSRAVCPAGTSWTNAGY